MIFNFLCISGFQQSEARTPGTWILAEKLRAAGLSSGTRLRVHHYRWNDDWNAKAEEIANLAKYYGEPAQTFIAAYSWGAGWGAMQMASQLYRRGLNVQKAVLSDPVYRHPWPFMRWLAMFGGSDHSRLHIFAPPVIRLPPNIVEAWVFRQNINKPAGHRVTPGDGQTLHPAVELQRVHGEMDDAPEFHETAMQAARQLVGQ